jgi:hypothetical protein
MNGRAVVHPSPPKSTGNPQHTPERLRATALGDLCENQSLGSGRAFASQVIPTNSELGREAAGGLDHIAALSVAPHLQNYQRGMP